MIPSARVRVASANPIELKLEPAIAHEVTVVAGGQAVENATVEASGAMFAVQGVTGREGKVRLLVPASEPVQRLVAWHPERGVRGTRRLGKSPRRDETQPTLLPPGPLTIRAMDPGGKPVPGLELGVGVADKDLEWAVTGTIDAARVRTDAEGRAAVPWAPREGLRYVDVDILDRARKIDAIDLETLAERLITVRVRRKVAVEGRLVMPEGEGAEGLLVTAYGFGPGDRSDVPSARARADGSFTLRVAPDHGFVLGIVDQEWAGDVWSGKILADETSKPAEIAIPVARATPVTVRVSRGPRHDPVADAWVEVGVRADVNWVDSTGKKKSGSAGIHSWLRTETGTQLVLTSFRPRPRFVPSLFH